MVMADFVPTLYKIVILNIHLLVIYQSPTKYCNKKVSVQELFEQIERHLNGSTRIIVPPINV